MMKADMDNGVMLDDLDQVFIGRQEALQAFSLLFSYHHMQNGIYYSGRGGQGKTFLLRKIFHDHHGKQKREVAQLIDFFSTENHSKRGLQKSIMNRMNRDEIFQPYLAVLADIEHERANPDTHPSVLTGLEKRADRVFLDCCQRASLQRELVLIFDTLEKVQNQEVGRWLLKDFLPNVRTPKIVLAGRPVPVNIQLPGNIRKFELSGLKLDEADQYLRKLRPTIPEHHIKLIHDHTGGSPLIMALIVGMDENSFTALLKAMEKMPAGAFVQDEDKLKCNLVNRYQNDHYKNYALWIMAFLKRRFDLPMLHYVAEHFLPWFKGKKYEDLFAWLSGLIFVKHYPHQESHLLHDEVQALLAECVLTQENFRWQKMQSALYELIIEHYYPEVLIVNASSEVEKNLLQSEQLGYKLDHNPEDGVAIYNKIRGDFPGDYDLEELMWIEVREHLEQLPDKGKKLCWERLAWLRKQNLYEKAEQHTLDMLTRFQEQEIDLQASLGYTYMRRGKIEEAEDILDAVLGQIPGKQYDLRARVENVRGQVAFRSGQWGEALKHYARSFQAASIGNQASHKISVYVNRAYLYSLQSQYGMAEKQCLNAFALIAALKGSGRAVDESIMQQETYAWMNLGTIRRHMGQYDLAMQAYQKCYDVAEQSHNLGAQCNVLGHIGVNFHLHGRELRRRAENLTAADLARACTDQLEGWKYLTRALEMAQRSDWQTVIADTINRLGKIYREIYHLSNLENVQIVQDTQVQIALNALIDQAGRYQLILEDVYQPQVFPDTPFIELGWREKSARLFEISSLAAERDNQYHRALDSLMELVRTLLWIRLFDQVKPALNHLMDIKGSDYQEKLFVAMVRISEAELELKTGKLEEAFDKYQSAYIDLARETSIASYLLIDRLRDLEWRLRQDVPLELRVSWCNRLEERWLEAGLAATHPEMIEKLEVLRSEFLVNSQEEV